MILLIIAVIIAGHRFLCFMVEHVALALLMMFCICCAFAIEKDML
jgi:hypothetical protein